MNEIEKMKYVIRNCPAYNPKGKYFDCWYDPLSWCQNINDCVLKQFVEKLKNPNNCKYSGKPLAFTDNILKLFDIKEKLE